MTILGLNYHHGDASAVLMVEGRIVAAVAEERLNRLKHCAGFPGLAVLECLRLAGMDIGDIEHVAVARNPRANLGPKASYALKHLFEYSSVVAPRLRTKKAKADVVSELAETCGRKREEIAARLHKVEHHLSHMASAYYPSGFDRGAVFSFDGSGDFATTMAGVGEGNKLEILWKIMLPHSLGILYTAACQFIGYDRYGDEGKVMGLAPYGEPAYLDFFSKVVRIKGRGFVMDESYFSDAKNFAEVKLDEEGKAFIPPLYSEKFVRAFGSPRKRYSEITDRDRDIAASLQKAFEGVYLHMLRVLGERTGEKNLCIAGGCALNSVANGMIFEETPFERIFAQPAASDDGTALGAALHVHHAVLGGERTSEMTHAFLGSEFSEAEMREALAAAGSGWEKLDEKELIERVSGDLTKGLVVGWYQGKMEWGPRALGNRSILAHPGFPGMKDILNARVKHRESFRPFAPTILADRTGEWFERSHPSPFMMLVYKWKKEKRELVSAVNHVDNTGRLQTIEREDNPLYYDLIAAFERRTGIPVLLNTSFNENEPIVCTPRDAVDCFNRTKMDVLVLGPFYCSKVAAGRVKAAPAALRGRRDGGKPGRRL